MLPLFSEGEGVRALTFWGFSRVSPKCKQIAPLVSCMALANMSYRYLSIEVIRYRGGRTSFTLYKLKVITNWFCILQGRKFLAGSSLES